MFYLLWHEWTLCFEMSKDDKQRAKGILDKCQKQYLLLPETTNSKASSNNGKCDFYVLEFYEKVYLIEKQVGIMVQT